MYDRTTAYAKKVVAGKILKGETEKLCCERHLKDLEKSKNHDYPYYFDLREAEKTLDIVNELTIIEGAKPQPLITRGFQDFIIGSLFGWRHKKNDFRRFREAYIQIARQNGKSFLAGAMANNFASFSGYREGKVYCTATKQDQAKIVWDEIRKFIEADKDLSELYKITEYNYTILSKLTGTVIKAIGRDTKSADGFRSILAIIDEYHAHPTNQMYKLMLDGQIGVDSPLTLAITTAGFEFNSPCHEHYEFCKQVLYGAIEKESQFIYITEMDKDDDIWDYTNWAKSNPLLLWNADGTYNMDIINNMQEKAVEAKAKGGRDLVNFKTKSLNMWVAYSHAQYVDLKAFGECASDMTLEDVKGKECYIGIDLSSGGDLTTVSIVVPLEDGTCFIDSHSFLPEARLEEHEKTDKAPYRQWAEDGDLTLTTGGWGVKTDYKFILHYLDEIIQKYKIKPRGVGYDSHNASAFLPDLADVVSCDLVEIRQSAKSLNDATEDFKLTVDARAVRYDKNNSLLRWSIANAKTTQNSFGEIKVYKEKQEARIDPVDAIIDAWKLMILNKDHHHYNADEDLEDWLNVMGSR